MVNIIVYIIITVFISVVAGLITKFLSYMFKTRALFLKLRIQWVLWRYIKNKDDLEKERKYVQKLGSLFDIGKRKLQSLGFTYVNGLTSIEINNFKIHFTRKGKKGLEGLADKFYIKKVENGIYFSNGYPEQKKQQNDIKVLQDFKEYFKML